MAQFILGNEFILTKNFSVCYLYFIVSK